MKQTKKRSTTCYSPTTYLTRVIHKSLAMAKSYDMRKRFDRGSACRSGCSDSFLKLREKNWKAADNLWMGPSGDIPGAHRLSTLARESKMSFSASFAAGKKTVKKQNTAKKSLIDQYISQIKIRFSFNQVKTQGWLQLSKYNPYTFLG